MNLFQFQNQSHGRKAILSTFPIIDLRTSPPKTSRGGLFAWSLFVLYLHFQLLSYLSLLITFQSILGVVFNLVDDKVLNELDGYKFGVLRVTLL